MFRLYILNYIILHLTDASMNLDSVKQFQLPEAVWSLIQETTSLLHNPLVWSAPATYRACK